MKRFGLGAMMVVMGVVLVVMAFTNCGGRVDLGNNTAAAGGGSNKNGEYICTDNNLAGPPYEKPHCFWLEYPPENTADNTGSTSGGGNDNTEEDAGTGNVVDAGIVDGGDDNDDNDDDDDDVNKGRCCHVTCKKVCIRPNWRHHGKCVSVCKKACKTKGRR
jgi:hypothetical protein